MILRRAFRFMVVLAVATALASTATGAVTEQLRRSIDRITAILADPALEGEPMTARRRAAVRQVLDEAIDFPEAARRVLGPHWRDRSDAERAEFVALFKELMEYSYILRIEPYAGETIVYAGESVDGDQATVRTRVRRGEGQDVAIEYRVHRVADRWLVYDLSVGGISLVANYRTQFNTIIQTSSYAEVLARIRTRLSDLATARPSAPP